MPDTDNFILLPEIQLYLPIILSQLSNYDLMGIGYRGFMMDIILLTIIVKSLVCEEYHLL